jgi:hypothetical protein
MEVVDFKAEHLTYILEAGLKDLKLKDFLTPEHGRAIEKLGGTFTVFEEGKPLVIGGIKYFWKNRGEAWLIFSQARTKRFMFLVRIIKNFLANCRCNRVEMIIDYDFKDGHRWATLLGFKKEAELLRSYLPCGGDASLYAIVRY